MTAGQVTVLLPLALAEHVGDQRSLSVDVDMSSSLRDVLDRVDAIAPAVGRRIRDETGGVRRFVNVYIGDDECRILDGLDTAVPPGTVVQVIGSVAGGS